MRKLTTIKFGILIVIIVIIIVLGSNYELYRNKGSEKNLQCVDFYSRVNSSGFSFFVVPCTNDFYKLCELNGNLIRGVLVEEHKEDQCWYSQYWYSISVDVKDIEDVEEVIG